MTKTTPRLVSNGRTKIIRVLGENNFLEWYNFEDNNKKNKRKIFAIFMLMKKMDNEIS